MQMFERKVVVFNSFTDSHSSSANSLPLKIKVHNLKPFKGARNMKKLEIFLWHMELYINTGHYQDLEKVMVTSVYLSGKTKLWWRTCLQVDENANRLKIETWEQLKKELKDQFPLCNKAWVSWESLIKLRNMSHIRDNVKDFSSMMFDIKNIAKEDQLFNFIY